MMQTMGKCNAKLVTLVGVVIVCIGIMANSVLADNALGIPDTEYNALVALYNSTGGANWRYKTNWLTENTPWYGVKVEGGHVTRIILMDKNLAGSLPAELGSLTNLQVLALSYNQLTGQIPPELGNMTSLQNLDLSGNQLTGQIPPELGSLTNLRGLDIAGNQLLGEVPSCITGFALLSYLDLGYNGLSCSDPVVLSFLVTKEPDWQDTQTIPPTGVSAGILSSGSVRVSWAPIVYSLYEGYYEVGYSSTPGGPYTFDPANRTAGKSDSYLIMHGLDVSSPVYFVVRTVSAASQWNQSEVTSLPSTEVQGEPGGNALGISESEYDALVALYNGTGGANWTHKDKWLLEDAPWYGVTVEGGHVVSINMLNNNLTGSVPTGLVGLTNLQSLYLDNNKLTGQIPTELVNLSSLQNLNLNWNQLTGQIPPELGNITSLQTLDLSGNELTGQIPTELANLTNLQNLWLNANQLTGQIPPELGNMTSLQTLDLSGNQLTGQIPTELANLTNLQKLWLEANQLTGQIPTELISLSSLQNLNLSWNQLTGQIPPELGNITSLQDLHLDANQLTGQIPPELGNISNLQYLDLGTNQLIGPIPPEFGRLGRLVLLDLRNNHLTGTIPPELGNLLDLQILCLSSNRLTCPIPSELGKLTKLSLLEMSCNQFVGEVPTCIKNLIWCGIDLWYNGLSCSDPAVLSIIARSDPYWQNTQTVPPTNVTAVASGVGSVTVSWTPILYSLYKGYYEVGYSSTPGGPYTFDPANRTASKSDPYLIMHGLDVSSPVYFVVRTVSTAGSWNQSELTSVLSKQVAAQPPASGKLSTDGSTIVLEDFVVTADFSDFFYVEKPDRAWGIRVNGDSSGYSRVNIIGKLLTNDDGERYIQAYSIEPVDAAPPPPGSSPNSAGTSDSGTPAPLYMPNRALGGGNLHYDPIARTGQCGVDGSTGLNNIGLLVKTIGKVVLAGQDWLYIDDGSGLDDGGGVKGLYVDTSRYPGATEGSVVWIKGISSIDRRNGRTVNTLLATDGGVIPFSLSQSTTYAASDAKDPANPRKR